jgi:hypothetical protein
MSARCGVLGASFAWGIFTNFSQKLNALGCQSDDELSVLVSNKCQTFPAAKVQNFQEPEPALIVGWYRLQPS